MSNVTPENQLQVQFEGRPWFHSVGRDEYNRLVVYTHYMCDETLHDVPDHVDGIQVLTHFAASKFATRDQFTSNNTDNIPTIPAPPSVEELDSDELELDVDDLCKELDRLEKRCGANVLMQIFFEIHDGKNAVTNMSPRFQDVRDGMEKLYDVYGFDPIYNELEG